jgi:hypothetical protein
VIDFMNATAKCSHTFSTLHLLGLAKSVLLLLWLSLPAAAWAKPPIRAAFFTVYPSAVGSKLDNLPSKAGHCGVCHYDFNGGGTRNPYGIAVGNSGSNSNAVWTIRLLDSDGDSFSTHMEITNTSSYNNTPTFPGLQSSNVNLVVNIPVGEVLPYITPSAASDTTPPVVQVVTPNGGQVWTANRATNITWSATDASGIASVNIYVSLNNGATYQQIARGLANSGTFAWTPADRPTTQARIKVVATDNYGNSTNDVSNAGFTLVSPAFTNAHGVASTLRDFDLPGTQPFEHGADLEASAGCASCHGGYNASVEPQSSWQGSMMAHASRDLLFQANMSIANQDAANSGDLCLRCHFPRGWLAGRSVPTDGSRMEAADGDGVSCALCHRMVDPVYQAGVSPTNDLSILAALSFPGTEYGNGMFVVDPTGLRRGPFSNAVAPHTVLGTSFHRQAAFCGTCHDVSNPAFQDDGAGNYPANAMNTIATNFSPHFMAPVERTYSEWLHSEYNTPTGVHAPRFAGNKADGRVSTCQDCHMRAVAGFGANTNVNAGAPWRNDLPLHDLTGGSTWLPGLLTNLFPADVNASAIQAGIARAQQLLTNAATLAVADASGQLKVTVTNECGHKLPTGYPEGRRVWLNVKFYDDAMNLIGESGAYNPINGVLTHDAAAKIYEVHPGLETNLANALGLVPGPSLHFVLNNQTYEDNRIPPRGFTNASFATFGGAPVGHSYADGQYWDDTLYVRPPGTTKAVAQLYYQSTSKEFVEFLRDENRTDTKGQAIHDLWRTNGMCPPTLLGEVVWLPIFELQRVEFTPQGTLQTHFRSRPGVTYTVEYTDNLNGTVVWHAFTQHGSFTATTTASVFEDDFTAQTSGGPSATGMRFYRFQYNGTP